MDNVDAICPRKTLLKLIELSEDRHPMAQHNMDKVREVLRRVLRAQDEGRVNEKASDRWPWRNL